LRLDLSKCGVAIGISDILSIKRQNGEHVTPSGFFPSLFAVLLTE
jgi:hypothetical protein